jgi:hypothetical protein
MLIVYDVYVGSVSTYVLVDEHGALHLWVDPDDPLGVQSDVDELVEGDDGRNAYRKNKRNTLGL